MSAELDAARSTYSSDHPDVLRLEREFAALRATLADVLANPSPVAEAFEVATPAEIRVRTELRSIQTEVAGLRTREREYRERVENYEGRLAQQPLIEREYDSLQRTYNAALRNYTEISDNLATAERAETLESESQAQRYILIESAYLPMEPLAPNRPAIVVVGLILAIAVAISMVIFLEAADGTVRGAKDVLNVSQYPPIGVIPVIKNTKDRRRILIGKAVYAGSLALMVTTTIALLQYT